MNNVMLVGALSVSLLALVGCNKKQESESSLDSNAVMSENVISVAETANVMAGDPNSVPVVENASTQAVQDVVDTVAVVSSDKPTPRNIQTALKNAGFYSGKVDGSIGPKTKKAIEAFQEKEGLKADGKVGPKTWRALSAYLNKTTEVANPTADVLSTTEQQ